MKLLKHLLVLSLVISVLDSFCQTVNVDYLNPTSTSTDYDYARFGNSSLYYAGFMYNKISQTYGDGDDFSIFTFGNRDLTFRTGTGDVIFFPSSGGNIGVGITSPSEKLHINGAVGIGKLSTNNTEGVRIEYVDSGSGTTTFKHNRWGGNFYFKRNSSSGERTQFYFGGSTTHKMDIYDGNNNVLVRIASGGESFLNGGNLGIGTTEPTEKLVVNGKILAEEIKVQNVPSSDYVFEPDYHLRPIEEVEAFVKENKHLPDIPSAEEFKENGVGLGEMDNMLLMKVEELMLYVIEQQNEIMKLKKENEEMKAKNKEMDELKAMVKAFMDER